MTKSVPFFIERTKGYLKRMANKQYPLPERIRKRKHFLLAMHNGRKFVAAGVVFQAVPNNKPAGFRVGFTTTKKLGDAVVRNRIRRRLREVVRLCFAPKALLGYDYVFIGRNATLDRDFNLLKKDVSYVLRQFKKSLSETLENENLKEDSTQAALSEESEQEVCQ